MNGSLTAASFVCRLMSDVAATSIAPGCRLCSRNDDATNRSSGTVSSVVRSGP